jgi:hypothetical protein
MVGAESGERSYSGMGPLGPAGSSRVAEASRWQFVALGRLGSVRTVWCRNAHRSAARSSFIKLNRPSGAVQATARPNRRSSRDREEGPLHRSIVRHVALLLS